VIDEGVRDHDGVLLIARKSTVGRKCSEAAKSSFNY
jgi:hypothetical protein